MGEEEEIRFCLLEEAQGLHLNILLHILENNHRHSVAPSIHPQIQHRLVQLLTWPFDKIGFLPCRAVNNYYLSFKFSIQLIKFERYRRLFWRATKANNVGIEIHTILVVLSWGPSSHKSGVILLLLWVELDWWYDRGLNPYRAQTQGIIICSRIIISIELDLELLDG